MSRARLLVVVLVVALSSLAAAMIYSFPSPGPVDDLVWQLKAMAIAVVALVALSSILCLLMEDLAALLEAWRGRRT